MDVQYPIEDPQSAAYLKQLPCRGVSPSSKSICTSMMFPACEVKGECWMECHSIRGATWIFHVCESNRIERLLGMGRCVVVMGMPFPNPTDPELRERMRFMDSAAQQSAAGHPQPGSKGPAPGEALEYLPAACCNRAAGFFLAAEASS